MATLSRLPFKASKRFILDGVQVEVGEVVDVSMLSAERVRNLEKSRYGIRVAADGPDHVPAPRPESKRASAPKRKPATKRAGSGRSTGRSATAPPVIDLEPEVEL